MLECRSEPWFVTKIKNSGYKFKIATEKDRLRILEFTRDHLPSAIMDVTQLTQNFDVLITAEAFAKCYFSILVDNSDEIFGACGYEQMQEHEPYPGQSSNRR